MYVSRITSWISDDDRISYMYSESMEVYKKIDVKKDKNFRYHLIQITILIMMRCFDIR